jgi:Tol biopolymer transport system component
MRLRSLLYGCVLLVSLWPCVSLAGVTERISLASSGEEAEESSAFDNWGESPVVVSVDGQVVVFDSVASNLVPADDNDAQDVFVRDRRAGTTELVSVSDAGEQGNDWSYGGSVSGDGRFVAFLSDADNLVPEDTNGYADVFLRDRFAGHTYLVSVTPTGDAQANGCSSPPSVSADGRYVAFASDATNLTPEGVSGVFVRDRQEATTELVSITTAGSPIAGHSYQASISADGRFVVFTSLDSSVVDEDSNDCDDVFVRDRVAGVTERISVNSQGEQANADSFFPSISADGRFVAFVSWADNIVPGDTNGYSDTFLRDRQLGTTQRISVGPEGEQLSGCSSFPSVSSDGRHVAYWSDVEDLIVPYSGVAGHVFVRDRQTAALELVSASSENEQAAGWASYPAISPDGRSVAFFSWAANLVPDDANDCGDVFIRDRLRFRDVPSDHWAFQEVTACAGAGIAAGYPDGCYHPEYAVTRAQMAVYVSRALAGGDSHVPAGPDAPSFPDVSSDHWAYDYIEYAAESGVVQGYPEGDYGPSLVVDRAQMAVYIARSVAGDDASVPDATGSPTFPDVTPDGEWSWCHKHVEYIAAEGIASGYDDGLYHPEHTCSRGQMAVFIQRAFHVPT